VAFRRSTIVTEQVRVFERKSQKLEEAQHTKL